jgi:hypothetical protein
MGRQIALIISAAFDPQQTLGGLKFRSAAVLCYPFGETPGTR